MTRTKLELGLLVVLNLTLAGGCARPMAPSAVGRSVVRLEKALTERIKRAGPGATAAVSLVDLESGLRFGINDEVMLGDAATDRVAVLLEILRQSDRGSLRLDDLVNVTRPDGSLQTPVPTDSDTALSRLIGGQLPVRELVRFMVVSSSPVATHSLVQRITPAALQMTMKELEAAGTAEGLARALELIARCKGYTRPSCDDLQRALSNHPPSAEFATGSPRTRIAHLSGMNGTTHYEAGILFPDGQKPYVLVIATGGFANETDAARMRADLVRQVADALTERRIAVPFR